MAEKETELPRYLIDIAVRVDATGSVSVSYVDGIVKGSCGLRFFKAEKSINLFGGNIYANRKGNCRTGDGLQC